jgi:hypothetical protein
MFFTVAVVHSFKRYFLESLLILDLLAQHSLCGVGIRHVVGASHSETSATQSALTMAAPAPTGSRAA